MVEKRLFRITVEGYALAETECRAIRAFESESFVDGINSVEAWETDSVDPEWLHAVPYGETEGRTCREILAAIRAAEDAATPDPNQLALPIEVAAERS